MDSRIYSIVGQMMEYKDRVSPFGGYFLLNPSSNGIHGNTIYGHIWDNTGLAEIHGTFRPNEILRFHKDYPGNVEWE